MNYLLPSAPGGGYFLVDMAQLVPMGDLVPVLAVNARSAFHTVMTGRYGAEQQWPPEQPLVYQIDAEGALIAVFD